MRAFTWDVESTDLTDSELVAFSQLVTEACHTSIQASLSAQLAMVTRPYQETTIDAVQRQARQLWRTALKL